MKKIITDDTSVTFHNKEFDETYHSVSGAIEEARKKFVEPSKIAELAKSGVIKIMDVCFGLGYNSGVAIDVALESNPDCKVYVTGFEIDTQILEMTQRVSPEIACYDLIQSLIDNRFRAAHKNVKIKLFIGDVSEEIEKSNNVFDVCFFDPFSPKKCPELWSASLFKKIYDRLKTGGVLCTYSCARIVRDNLKEAGFEVHDGPSVGRRAPSTIAVKK